MPRKRIKSKKKYAKGGKLKLSTEEWEEQTGISSFSKRKKIEVKLVEMKPNEKDETVLKEEGE